MPWQVMVQSPVVSLDSCRLAMVARRPLVAAGVAILISETQDSLCNAESAKTLSS